VKRKNAMFKPDRKDLLVVLLLVVLCALFFWRFLTPSATSRVMFPKGDFSYQFYSWRAMAFRELRQGRFPLWTNCIYSGYPLQADPQSALFYPPALVTYLANWVAGLKTFSFRLLEWEVIAHVFLTSVFTYAFLRSQLKRRLSALLGSVAFAYGGYLTSYPLLQVAIVESAAWLPLALLGARALYQEQKRSYLWLVAFAFGMTILAGHTQTSMLVVYATLAYMVYQAWRTGTPWHRGLRDLLFVLVIAGGLGAVQALPSLEYARYSTRADLPVDQAGTGFPPLDLVQFVLTGLVSLWQPLYIGIWPLLLAAVALRTRALDERRRGDTLFWLGVAVVALVLSFGRHLFGFELAYLLLPGYHLFRGQERLALLVSLALSVLAAEGADVLWGALMRRERLWLRGLARLIRGGILATGAALVAAIWLHRQGIDPSDSGELPNHLAILLLMAVGSLALLSARLYNGTRRLGWNVLSIALVVVNLFSLNRAVNQAPVDPVYPPAPATQLMAEDESQFRFQDDYRLPPQSACVLDLEEVTGIAPIRPAHYERFLEEAPEAVRWALLNVKYVVSWRGSLVSREGQAVPADVVHTEGEGKEALYVHRLREPGPRAWVVRGVYQARDADQVYEYMRSPLFDPARGAVLQEQILLSSAASGGADSLSFVRQTPLRIQILADLPSEGLLVLSEVTYPGWRAYVNGKLTPIHEANGILRAVLLPAGRSFVEFRYVPISFYLGLALSIIAWVLLISAVVSLIYKGRPLTSRRAGETPA